MGFLDKLLKPTPFYNSYKKYESRKAELIQEKLETKLHPLRVDFYKQFISNNDVVFDIGANVGNRVASFLECGAKVIAVEPQPVCVDILKVKFGDQIIIENVGLGDAAGSLEMHISTDTTVSSFSEEYIAKTKERFKYSKWVDTIRVPVTTLDSLVAKYGTPKFCKIDVEGYELHVLKGLSHPLPLLSIEYCVPEIYQQLVECINYLNALSPNGVYNYSIGESMQLEFSTWLTFKDFSKHIAANTFKKPSFGDIYFKSN